VHELLATVSLAQAAWHLGATWIICGLAVLIGLGAGRRLPAGVGEGLFVAGLSGLLFAAYLPMYDPEQSGVQLCAVLTALAVLWRFAPRWAEHRMPVAAGELSTDSAFSAEPPATQHPAADPSTVIRSHAILLCGAAVAGISLRLSAEASREQRLAVTLCLMLLFALALRPRTASGSGLSWYAWLGLLACALRIWVLPQFEVWPARALTALVCLGGMLALVAALVPIFTYWRQRRRDWQLEPDRLLEPPPRKRLWWTGVQALAGLTGIAALVVRYEPLAPFGPALAAFAASTAGYRERATAGGSLALVLACETVILAALAWLPDFGFNALMGTAVAGLWMLWLARFWHQQLHNGQPWTYAGQLIGAARRISHAAAAICFVLAVAEVAVPAAAPAVSVAQILWAGGAFLVILLFARALVRDAGDPDNWFGPFAACLMLPAALVPLQAALMTAARSWAQWPLLLALALLLLALLSTRKRREAELQEWVYNAHIGGLLPVAILCLGWNAGPGLLWIATAPVALIGFGLRWRRESKPVAAATFEPRRR
jgi:hypothetical protein